MKIISAAKKYVSKMTVFDVGLLKICLCAIGVMIGIAIKPAHKKRVLTVASILFSATFSLIMPKFLKTLVEELRPQQALK